jgi:hypothetical protein
LPSLGIRRVLTFHILIFSSETSQPNELKSDGKNVIFTSFQYYIKPFSHFLMVKVKTKQKHMYIFLFLIGRFKKNSPLEPFGQMNRNLEASMEGPLFRLHISSWSVNKHGRHRLLLFLIGWYFLILLLWNTKWVICIEDLP